MHQKLDILFNNFHTLFGTEKAFAKLNELVLSLAVQGKLTEKWRKDHPDVEPARELLKKILAEKEKLINEFKIKNNGKVSPIKNEQIEYAIPKTWNWLRLGEINWNKGQKIPKSKFTYLDVTGIKNTIGSISEDLKIIPPENAPSRARKIVSIGCLLYSSVRPYLLNIAIIKKDYDPSPIASTAFIIFNPIPGISSEFLFYYLRSKFFINWVSSQMVGMAYPAISENKFIQGPFPLPPLEEQREIVSIVESLQKKIEAMKESYRQKDKFLVALNRSALNQLTNGANGKSFVQAVNFIHANFDTLYSDIRNVKELRQTILQLAVQGKLTEKERPALMKAGLPAPQSNKFFVYVLKCSNDSNYIGQTSDLHKRWDEHTSGKGADWTKRYPPKYVMHWDEFNSRKEAMEREKFLKTGFGRKWIKREEAKGELRRAGEPASELIKKIKLEKEKLIAEGKIKRQAELPPIKEEEKPYPLPEGWEWVRLGEICELKSGIGVPTSKIKSSGDIMFIKVSDMNMDINEKKIESSNHFISKSIGTENDFIPPNSIIFPKRGGAIATNKKRFVSKNIIVDPNIMAIIIPKEIDIYYFRHWFETYNLWDLNSGTSVPQINNKDIYPLLFPLPFYNEQNFLVKKLAFFLKLCDQIEKKIEQTEEDSGLLLEAILQGHG